MTNRLCIAFLILLISLSAVAQTADNTLSDYRNYLPAEGGGKKVTIDTITPLPQLINRLADNWELAMTFKAYWIGYTDDMFSIAEYGDNAINPLTHFIDTVHSVKAKRGAIYTLHLVGINSTIIDRFLEKFENRNARKALLKYLADTTLHTLVLELLMRDPWITDIPVYMAYLEEPGRDYSTVLSVLKRYEIKDPPLNQRISGGVFERPVKIKANDYGIKPIDALVAFQSKFSKHFIVDNEILNSQEWIRSRRQLSIVKFSTRSKSVMTYFMSDYFFSYCSFSEIYNYNFDGENITVYGPTRAREAWLNWWKKIPQDEKEQQYYSRVAEKG